MGDLEISDGLVWGEEEGRQSGVALDTGTGTGEELELNKPFNISCIFTSI